MYTPTDDYSPSLFFLNTRESKIWNKIACIQLNGPTGHSLVSKSTLRHIVKRKYTLKIRIELEQVITKNCVLHKLLVRRFWVHPSPPIYLRTSFGKTPNLSLSLGDLALPPLGFVLDQTEHLIVSKVQRKRFNTVFTVRPDSY